MTTLFSERAIWAKKLLGTWSGRIIAINALVFLAMSWQSGSIMMPNPEVLLAWGAKDPVLFARGEYWRIITPIFVHIGFVHFFLNMWALHVLSQHVERILGGALFLTIYLVAGMMGNIFSLVFSLAVSAGASSSVFGIMGAGFLIEFLTGRRAAATLGIPRPRNMYSGLLIVNIILGFVIPQIDSAAHFGGLLAGLLLTFAVLCLRPNPVLQIQPRLGIFTLVLMAVLAGAGVYTTIDSRTLFRRFIDCGAKGESNIQQYHCYAEALRIDPFAFDARLGRGKVLISANEWEAAKEDLIIAAQNPESHPQLAQLQMDLDKNGDSEKVAWLAQLLTSSQK